MSKHQKPKRHQLQDLIDQCDPDAPIPETVHDWDSSPEVGLEQLVMDNIVDIEQAVIQFGRRVTKHYTVKQLILFGSRARGDYHKESDADVAVILEDPVGDFVETKLAIAGIAFDNLVDTGVLVQALPIWESQWADPATYDNPALLINIATEGKIITL
tara:strand:- start:2736 stop:3209 length:474 start_codon:yes stop_codon:yes gene_type:complete